MLCCVVVLCCGVVWCGVVCCGVLWRRGVVWCENSLYGLSHLTSTRTTTLVLVGTTFYVTATLVVLFLVETHFTTTASATSFRVFSGIVNVVLSNSIAAVAVLRVVCSEHSPEVKRERLRMAGGVTLGFFLVSGYWYALQWLSEKFPTLSDGQLCTCVRVRELGLCFALINLCLWCIAGWQSVLLLAFSASYTLMGALLNVAERLCSPQKYEEFSFWFR